MGNYDQYLDILSGNSSESVESLGNQITGEFFHVMTIDHTSPFQIHYEHDIGDDGCEDTDPSQYSNNLLGCDFDHPGGRCHLTQCQLGRMHRFFDFSQPGFERFLIGHEPDGTPIFSISERNCYIVDPDIIIPDGADIIWSGPKRLRSNVVVQSGGNLTITCEVGMPADARITVEEGGRLRIDGGRVYNNCAARWQGIVVEGDFFEPQSFGATPHHGRLFLFNGSTLEGANTSVRVEGGGFVWGIGSTVLNCGGMEFEPYSFSNKSRFGDCNFIMDGNAFQMDAPFFHASLISVRDVRFSRCSFRAEDVQAERKEFVVGISAQGAGFRVNDKTSFSGFDRAIAAAGSPASPFSSFSVSRSIFRNNNTAIEARNITGMRVLQNEFFVGGTSFQESLFEPAGIRMDECTAYRIEDNGFDIDTDGGDNEKNGILTEDSGREANRIMVNRFDNLDVANLAQGDNTGMFDGLQFWCNENLGNNERDFLVPCHGDGIFVSQGNGNGADNTFSHNNVFADGDFRNGVGVIDYYHTSPPDVTPENHFGITPIQASEEAKCPKYGGGGTGSEVPIGIEGGLFDDTKRLKAEEWQDTEDKFYSVRDSYHSAKAALESLLDGDGTPDLRNQVEAATAADAPQAVQDMLAASPYLSVGTMKALLTNDGDAFDKGDMVNVLSANPEGARKPPVFGKAKETLDEGDLETVYSDTSKTGRSQKEMLASQYRGEMHRLANILLRDLLKDTTGLDLALLRTWLANKESMEADYAIAATYISEGDKDTALGLLAAMPAAHGLEGTGLDAHDNYIKLANFWFDKMDTGTPLWELSQDETLALQEIADVGFGIASATAQGMLNALGGPKFKYRINPKTHGNCGSGGPKSLGGKGLLYGNGETGISVTAYPNPAGRSVTFGWQLPAGSERGLIVVSDLQGRDVERLGVFGERGKTRWETARLGAGIYYFTVRSEGERARPTKLVILK